MRRLSSTARQLFLATALCAACAASAAEDAAPAPLRPPDPASFRAYDQPSDDGSDIGVEWGRSPSEREGGFYVLEVASEEDAQAGKFKRLREPIPFTKAPDPIHGDDPEARKAEEERPKVLKSDFKKYFGLSRGNRDIYYVAVTPSAYYPPKPEKIRPARKGDFADQEREKTERRFEAERMRDERRKTNGRRYYFRLAISDGKQTVYVAKGGEPAVVSAQARPNLFERGKLVNLVFSVLFCGTVLGFIRIARRNPNLFIRRIAGLDALDEAIGRATEMGQPVMFVHGLGGMGDLGTIAAVNILARVSRRAAEYDTRVRVANNDYIVMAVSQEVVKQAYTEAGRPDAYRPDDVVLVAYEQFSYVAAVAGMMMRERPAAIFHMGYFYAEALFLAETGASTGAIQIAGTDAYTQLPFFITTCDYTLIGEELYAASAYLSRQPMLLGSLRGQDIGKAFLMLVLIVGTILALCGVTWLSDLLQAYGVTAGE